MFNKCLFAAVLVIALCSAANAKQMLGLNENHPYGVLTNTYVTPHVNWANPYYMGKIKTLVIAPIWSQRETVELAQRLSLDYSAWMTSRFHQAVSTNDGDPAANSFLVPPDLAYRTLDAGLNRKLDVIIIGKQVWTSIPEAKRFAILKKVSEGTGLVYVNPQMDNKELEVVFGKHVDQAAGRYIASDLPLSSLPRFANSKPVDLIKAGKFGKGRVVGLFYSDPKMPDYSEAYPCLTPVWDLSEPKVWTDLDKLPEMELVPYDYYQAFVAKAVLWASWKQSGVKFTSVSIPEQVKWPTSKQTVQVNVDAKPSGSSISAVVRHRLDYGRTFVVKAKQTASGAVLTLPDIAAGNYFLDVWIKTSDGKTINWASRAFAVMPELSITKLNLDRILINPGESVTCTAAFSRPLSGGETAVASLWDNYGRKMHEKDATGGSFVFTVDRPLSILHSVRFTVRQSGKPLAERVLQFPVRARLGWDDFNDIVWASAGNHFITLQMLKKLYDQDQVTGLDVGWQFATSARNTAWSGMAAAPYTARYGVFSAGPDHIIPTPKPEAAAYGPMASPDTLQGVKDWGAIESAVWGPYGPYVWTHGDETYFTADPDIDWSLSSLVAFQEYLRGVYPNLAALNAEWKTAYANWNEVMPITFKDARVTKNYAPWLEHKRSSDLIFANFYNATGKAMVDDPGARAGFDGGGGLVLPNSGADWWLLSKKMDILHSYIGNSDQMEIQRSFQRKGQVSGMWYGTYGWGWAYQMPSTPEYNQFFMWDSLFHGLNSSWFWMMGAPGNLSGYAGDLTSLPFFESHTQALAKIRSGIGKLLLTGTRENDKIAVHFSEASRIADSLMAERESDYSAAYAKSLVDFNKALEDSGLQYQYVSYEQVETGELAKGGYKVFIMPHSWSVSTVEARQIREFVSDGGTVIADVVPGTLNGHGTLQVVSMLADLFPSPISGTITNLGKGKAILVGDALKGYGEAHMREAGWKTWPEFAQKRNTFFTDVLKPLGILPGVKIQSTTGQMPPTEVHRFKTGDIEFVGLLRQFYLNDMTAYSAKVIFPYKSYVYDVMKGKYLGNIESFSTRISFQAQLYALMPYKVESVQVAANSEVAPGKTWNANATLKTSGSCTGTHCFRVEVVSPKGEKLASLAQNVLAPNGTASFGVDFALNDPIGSYKVIIRDAVTGIETTKKVVLR